MWANINIDLVTWWSAWMSWIVASKPGESLFLMPRKQIWQLWDKICKQSESLCMEISSMSDTCLVLGCVFIVK